MIEVQVDSIRVRLTPGQERLVLLRDLEQDRQLPIYVGPFEADAISWELKGYTPSRPLTHDLLLNCLRALGGELQYVLINELRENHFRAQLHVVRDDQVMDIDARSSDSIALAVRAKVPIYVDDAVMDEAGVWPAEPADESAEQLAAFRDFVETLDLDDLGEE